MLLARLLRRPDGWPGAARAAACLCAAAVVLAGCGGGPAGEQASGGGCTPVTASSQPGAGPWRAENSCTRQRLYGVACLSRLRCEAVGAAGTIVATGDGGRTWRAQANPLRGSSTALYAIAGVAPDAADCPTSTGCHGVQSANLFGGPNGGVNVYQSSDGGAGWDQIGPQLGWSSSVLNAITCPAALTCYLAGSRGSIARITNGTTLTAQRTPTARDLYGIGCAGPATCYAVGDDGTILALG